MKAFPKIATDATFISGIVLIIVSLALYLLPDMGWVGNAGDLSFSIFVANFVISIAYFVAIWRVKIHRLYLGNLRRNIEYGFLHLILCLISAYSLNRQIPVFEKSTPWLQTVLVIQGIVLIILFFKTYLPRWVQFCLFTLLGIGFMLFLYLSFYLIPVYPVGIMAFFVLGVSLHAFVPLWLASTILFYLFRPDNRNKVNVAGFLSGVAVSLTIVCVFIIQWSAASSIITNASDQSLLNEKNDLPEWVVIAQHLPKNIISEEILKTGLVYSTHEKADWGFFDMPGKGFDEVRKHDPLIILATFFKGKPILTDNDKINILESMYDSRHQAQERLWSGDELQTSHVITNARIFPGLRIGYTEKIISIRNCLSQKSWRRSQEAIYTFHLPEGAVVTSLSLWINGKEEKGVLTSKHKADSAYATIVGVEQHDPSLVRWQEGNTVTVRVFPCTPEEDRRFKIGITAPLRKEKQKLVYDNIWFDGPPSEKAMESTKIEMMDKPENLVLPSFFKESNTNVHLRNGLYKADWSFRMTCPSIINNSFSFNGKSYKIAEYNKAYQAFDPQKVYLDVNSGWSWEEFENVLKIVKSKYVYVYNNQLIQINDINAKELFNDLSGLNFSVFPLYEIKDPAKSLLISKGSASSPNVSDLKDSEFETKLKSYFKSTPSLQLYNLGYEMSPYLKTLKELRAFQYDFGDLEYLGQIIHEKKFIKTQEDANTFVIDDAAIKITEGVADSVSNAPDHLMRLFSYNQVMFLTGLNYLNKDFFNKEIADKAHAAYVVSPVTSLVVLETQQDYKRFGITDDGTSLKNASMKSSGAVPEPHEWLLILLLAGVIIFLIVKSKGSIRVKHSQNGDF